MTICKASLASTIIALLIIGSTVVGCDNAREELSNVEEAEKKLQELKLSFQQLQQTNDEQKRALELAEKELKRTKLDASSSFGKLTMNLAVSFWKEHAKPSIFALTSKTTEKMVHAKDWSEPHIGSVKNKWVPAAKQQFEIFLINMVPYMKDLSTKTVEVYEVSKNTMKPHLEKGALSFYKKWVRAAKQQFEILMIDMVPYMKILPTKIVEVYDVSKSAVEPHFDKVQEMALSYYTKWVPVAKQQFDIFVINMEPYLKKLSTKTIEVYEASKSTVKPHFDKVQELAFSYFKEAWSYLKLYADQLFIMTKPLAEKLQIFLKPLIEYAALMYCKLPTRKNTYNHQIKSNIDKHPRKHGLIWAYVTKELVSVMAYVLLTFSVLFLCRFLESIVFTKKRKQLKRTSHASEPQRMPKRRRADN